MMPQRNTAKWGQIKFQDTLFPATAKQLRKFALTPLCALPEDDKTKTTNPGWQAAGEDLVLQKSSANTRSPKQQSGDRAAPCYRFFIPSPFTTRRASHMVRNGLNTSLRFRFTCQICL
jgi:hypothetical protein